MSQANDFDFDEGDTVLVKVRDGGDMVAKFVGECRGFRDQAVGSTRVARFDLPFGTMNSVTIRPYEGEFEVVDGPSEVNF